MIKKDFSIIIPVKDRVGEFIKLILSLKKLKPLPNEIIAVDDCSELVNYKKLKKFCKKEKIKFYRNKKTKGPAISKNIGAKISKSSFLWFLDSDTVSLRIHNLIEPLKFFEKKPNSIIGCEIVKRKRKLFTRSSYLLPNCQTLVIHNSYSKKNKIRKVDFLPSCNLIISKKNFLKIKGFRNIITAEDKLFCLMAKKKQINTYFFPKLSILHEYSELGRVTNLKQIKNIIECNMIIFGFYYSKNMISYYFRLIISLPLFIISQLLILSRYNHKNSIKKINNIYYIIMLFFFNKNLKKLLIKGNKFKNEL